MMWNTMSWEMEVNLREDFILAQDYKMQAKIFSNLTYLEAMGPSLREPYSKPLFLRGGAESDSD